MTGYTVHTGASKKFVAGWDNIFGDKPSADEADSKKKKKKKKPTAKQKKAKDASARKKKKS